MVQKRRILKDLDSLIDSSLLCTVVLSNLKRERESFPRSNALLRLERFWPFSVSAVHRSWPFAWKFVNVSLTFSIVCNLLKNRKAQKRSWNVHETFKNGQEQWYCTRYFSKFTVTVRSRSRFKFERITVFWYQIIEWFYIIHFGPRFIHSPETIFRPHQGSFHP